MYQHKLEFYKQVERTTGTPRENDARVLTQGALKLKQCLDRWDSEQVKKTLHEALIYNQKIWSIFQADLTSGDHPLPDSVRLDLVKLSTFVDRQIFTAMACPDPEVLKSIIDVNLGLAAGLRKKPAQQQARMEPQHENSIRGIRG